MGFPMARIRVLLDEAQKARYRGQAEREVRSLGAWLRQAAEEKLAASSGQAHIESAEDLRRFVELCDAREQAHHHPELGARDLLHLACCQRRGVTEAKTYDRGLAAAFHP